MKTEMGFEGATEGINDLISKLNEISTTTLQSACKDAVTNAVPIVLNEEKRILSANPKYAKFAKMLSYDVYKNRFGNYVANCGYSTETIKNNIEVLIIEFGRPGSSKKAVQKGGIDKKKRKIGVIQPYSHIRAAWFSKKDEVKKFMGDYVYDEIRKVWVSKNGRK